MSKGEERRTPAARTWRKARIIAATPIFVVGVAFVVIAASVHGEYRSTLRLTAEFLEELAG